MPKLGRPNNRHTDSRLRLEVQRSPVDDPGCLIKGPERPVFTAKAGTSNLGQTRLSYL